MFVIGVRDFHLCSLASIVGPGIHLWSQICQDIRRINAISITCKFNTKGCQGRIPPQLAIALQRQHIPLKQDVYHLDSSSPSFWQGVPGSIHFAPKKNNVSQALQITLCALPNHGSSRSRKLSES